MDASLANGVEQIIAQSISWAYETGDEPAKGLDWLSTYSDAIGAPTPNVQEGSEGWERGASNTKARMDYEWSPLYPS